MAEPWIRVHANLVDKPIIDRAVDALDVSEHEAIGLMVTFWGSVSQNIIGGQLADVSDRQIERWARWHGRRGRFANFIRTAHLDADGRVNEWDEYAGALEQRRAKERERLRNKRRPVAQHDSNNGHDVAQRTHETVNDVARLLQPARAIRNETKRVTTSSSSSARAWIEALSDAASANMQAVLARASDANACLTALGSMATGNDPATPQPTSAALEVALHDYAANGERWNAALFRAYLKRAAPQEPRERVLNGTNGHARASPDARRAAQGGARNDAAIDAWLADKERQQSETVETIEPEPEEIPHGE
jgi:hypothetical protein